MLVPLIVLFDEKEFAVQFCRSFMTCLFLGVSVVASADEPEPMTDAEASSPPPVKLRYQFRVSEDVRYRVQSQSTMITQAALAMETVRNKANELKHFHVSAIDDEGNATFVCTLDHVRMWAQFNDDDPIQFASDWPKSRVPFKYHTVWKSVDKPLARMKVSPQGKLLDLHLLEHERYKKGTQGPLAAPESSLDFDQVNFLVEFPEEPVKIGGTWSQRLKLTVQVDKKLSRNINILRTYKLEAVRDGIARIKMVTSVLGRVYDPRVQVQLLQREPRGEIKFDIAKGQLVSRDTVIEKQLLEPFGSKSSVSVKSTRSEELVAPRGPLAVNR